MFAYFDKKQNFVRLNIDKKIKILYIDKANQEKKMTYKEKHLIPFIMAASMMTATMSCESNNQQDNDGNQTGLLDTTPVVKKDMYGNDVKLCQFNVPVYDADGNFNNQYVTTRAPVSDKNDIRSREKTFLIKTRINNDKELYWVKVYSDNTLVAQDGLVVYNGHLKFLAKNSRDSYLTEMYQKRQEEILIQQKLQTRTKRDSLVKGRKISVAEDDSVNINRDVEGNIFGTDVSHQADTRKDNVYSSEQFLDSLARMEQHQR